MKKLLSALFLLALCSSLAMATVPDPQYCTVTPLLGPRPSPSEPPYPATAVAFLSPAVVGGTTLTITVKNHSNAVIPNAAVSVSFDAAIRTCPGVSHTATTDGSGVCHITLRGGGCLSEVLGACVIVANGQEIKNLNFVRSPDNNSHTAPAGDGDVGLIDLGFFGPEFKGTYSPAKCHDYDNDGLCNLIDLGYFGPSYKSGVTCL